MKGEFGFSLSEYLQRHLEQGVDISEVQRAEYVKPLRNYPVGVENYQILPESGETTVGNFTYRFNLGEINPHDFFLDQEYNIAEMIESSPEGPTDEQAQKMMYRFLLYDYNTDAANRARVLNKFEITNEELNNTINITDSLPKGYKIIFNPKFEEGIEKIVMDAKGKNVFIEGNLLCLKSIVDLLHEIGHGVILESLEGAKKGEAIEAHEKFIDVLIQGGNISDETLAVFLKNERDAWAFALKIIRNLLRKPERESDVLTILDKVNAYIHQNILKQNSEQIIKMKSPNFKGLMREALDKKLEGKNNFDIKKNSS